MPAGTRYTAILEQLRRNFRSGTTFPIEWRKNQLKNLRRLVEENEKPLCDALYADIHRSKAEGYFYEVAFAVNEVGTALANLESWMKPQKVGRNMLQLMDSAYIVKDPLGVVLIISPWNYPVQLLFCPLVGALAAGNCAVLKPSEIAPNTAKLIADLVPKYFEPDVVQVVLGGVAETSELLKERFDHIFYTGAPRIGKIVMETASKHLTPVTLELGGKCPAIIDKGCDLKISGRRIAWGKYMSCGQSCLAPDHILCPKECRDELLEGIRAALKEYYTEDPQKAPDYSRIISQRHFDRLVPYLTNSGRVALGGKNDRSDLYIEPTVLFDVKTSDPVMEEEIFGPILPILTVSSLDEAIEIVNGGEKPLGLYIFSKSQKNIDKILERTSSGGVTINDVMLHMGLETLPFGGVGESGMGRYHGKFSFDTFTHEKAVLQRPVGGEKILWMRYPPYDDQKMFWTKELLKRRALPAVCFVRYVPLFLLGLLIGYLLRMWA